MIAEANSTWKFGLASSLVSNQKSAISNASLLCLVRLRFVAASHCGKTPRFATGKRGAMTVVFPAVPAMGRFAADANDHFFGHQFAADRAQHIIQYGCLVFVNEVDSGGLRQFQLVGQLHGQAQEIIQLLKRPCESAARNRHPSPFDGNIDGLVPDQSENFSDSPTNGFVQHFSGLIRPVRTQLKR